MERLTGVYKNMARGVVALVYRCRPIGGTPVETDEAQRVCWLAPEEVGERLGPAFAIRVLDALGDRVASRAHDGVRLVDG